MLQLALPSRRQMMRAHRTLANHVAAFKTFARVILVNPRCSGRPGQSGRPSQSGRRVGVVDEKKISVADKEEISHQLGVDEMRSTIIDNIFNDKTMCFFS